MKLQLDGHLPFVPASLVFDGHQLDLEQVLLDTGSAGSVFSADAVEAIGIEPEGGDRIRRILGVGGSEFVYSKKVEKLTVGDLEVEGFEIQIGPCGTAFRYMESLGWTFCGRRRL